MAASGFPNPLVIDPATAHELTVILLHGRGSSPQEFSDYFGRSSARPDASIQSQFPSVKWIFPSAKNSYSSVFQEELSEWFNIWSLTDVDAKWEIQLKGLGESIRHIREVIEQEKRLFEKQGKNTDRRIVLGGLSMGCATGVHIMLSLLAEGQGAELAAFFGWCGWMPMKKMVEKAGLEGLRGMYIDLGLVEKVQSDGEEKEGKAASSNVKNVPVLLSHCTDDGVVEVRHGREMKGTLATLGLDVKWTEYKSHDHWVKEPEAVDELVGFLERQLSKQKSSQCTQTPS